MWTIVRLIVAALLALPVAMPTAACATLMYEVSFDDPGATNASFYSEITSSLQAAGSSWAQYLVGTASLQVQVRFSGETLRAGGASAVSRIVGRHGDKYVAQDGAGFETATGIDPNGTAPDIIISFDPTYLMNELWFDPEPDLRTTPVPSDKTDAVSVLLHELGHAFGFNGFHGLFPSFESSFDALTTFQGGLPFFTGATAEAIYGGPVPLTLFPWTDSRSSENLYHLGNVPPGPGTMLVGDLMNGIAFGRGARYAISPLDVAMLHDTGIPARFVALPSTLLLVGIGLVPVLLGTRRRDG